MPVVPVLLYSLFAAVDAQPDDEAEEEQDDDDEHDNDYDREVHVVLLQPDHRAVLRLLGRRLQHDRLSND